MKKHKIITLILVIAMLATVFTACGKKGENTDEKPAADAKNTESSNASDDNAKDLSPVTLTLFNKDTNSNWDDYKSTIAEELKKKTGVTLQVEFPTGELAQKIALMIAGNDYPDMIFAGGDHDKIIQAGGFIDLTELIEKHGPNIKKMYANYWNSLRFNKEDSSIYTLPTFGVDQEKWVPAMGFEIQHAAIIDAGYPELKTLEDAEKVVADYVKKNPKIDGQPTIGLSIIADDWRWMSAVGNMAAFLTGKPDDGQWYVDPDTCEADYRFTRDDHKEYFKWLNHMNDIGLLDPESFTQKYDQYAAKISSGRVVALNDQLWQYSSPEDTLKTSGKFERTYGVYPVQLNDSYKCADFRPAGLGSWGIGITTSCKNPERAIQFMDYICSDEGQVLVNWGIKDVTYKVDEDGKRYIPEEMRKEYQADPVAYTKKYGVGNYVHPFPHWGDGVVDSTGSTYTNASPDTIVEKYNDVEKDVLSHYNAKMWADLYPKASEFKPAPYGPAWQITIADNDMSAIMKKCDDLSKQGVAKAVMAKPADFENVWNDLQKQLKQAGVEKLEEYYTGLVKERAEVASGK